MQTYIYGIPHLLYLQDILPPHGFLAKPSTLWPIDPIPPPDGRVRESKSNPPPKPGHADTLEPEPSRVKKDVEEGEEAGPPQSQEDMLKFTEEGTSTLQNQVEAVPEEEYEQWEPKPPKVLMEDPKAVPLELLSQIQLYATNE